MLHDIRQCYMTLSQTQINSPWLCNKEKITKQEKMPILRRHPLEKTRTIKIPIINRLSHWEHWHNYDCKAITLSISHPSMNERINRGRQSMLKASFKSWICFELVLIWFGLALDKLRIWPDKELSIQTLIEKIGNPLRGKHFKNTYRGELNMALLDESSVRENFRRQRGSGLRRCLHSHTAIYSRTTLKFSD